MKEIQATFYYKKIDCDPLSKSFNFFILDLIVVVVGCM